MITLLAPLSGVIVPLDRVPDPVFAQRIVGDGVSIDPINQSLVAPCDGRVIQLHRAGHAVTLAAGGLEILIHVGLDTVTLNGQGFTPCVKAGDQVRAGDELIRFDGDFVATHARSLLTEIVVTSMERVASLRPGSGHVTAGRDVVLTVVTSGEEAGTTSASTEAALTSAPVVVASRIGLHARPAALVAARARQFAADVRLVKDGREANARSVVSIMALEVSGGESITIVARGSDADAAVRALTELLNTDLDEGQSAAPPAETPRTERADEAVIDAAGGLRGVPAAPGAAVGQVYQFRHEEAAIEERAADPNHERRSLDAAIASAHVQLEALQARLAEDTGSSRTAIFAAHQELLEDPEVLDAAAAHIRSGATAAYAWRQAYTAQADRLLVLRNQLLAARAADLKDVGRRVLHLLIGHDEGPRELPPDTIVVAEDLTPSDAATLDRTRVRGICTTMGSATSHVAILARALAIPAVAGLDPRALDVPGGTRAIVDGDAGMLQPSPSPEDERRITERQRAADARRSADLARAAEPATTTDGHRVEIAANIGGEEEGRRVPELGGDGVGLLRTEFLFMDRRTAPDEDEQTRVYEAIARALGPSRILVIRTLDVGGDKPLPYLPMAAEPNPFLGERGIRLTLHRPDLFRSQLRAILRASHAGRVAVMFPMIATLGEWRSARDQLETERTALGVPPIQTGIMVETAAAALLADRFAVEADFFSIGTNDLTQYTLAMDRSHPRLAPQVDALHPSVLRLIEQTVAGGHAHGRWVGVCGALAGDPEAVPVLVGLGVDELSVSLPAVPAVKAQVRGLSLADCRVIAERALAAEDAVEVRHIVSAG